MEVSEETFCMGARSPTLHLPGHRQLYCDREASSEVKVIIQDKRALTLGSILLPFMLPKPRTSQVFTNHYQQLQPVIRAIIGIVAAENLGLDLFVQCPSGPSFVSVRRSRPVAVRGDSRAQTGWRRRAPSNAGRVDDLRYCGILIFL